MTESAFWRRNVRLFLSRFPGLAESLGVSGGSLSLPDGSPNPAVLSDGIELCPSRSAGVVTARSCGRLLHSQYDPIREAESAVRRSRADGTKAAVFLGFGLGYAASAWARLFPRDTLVLVEPDPSRFFTALAAADWSDVLSAGSVVLALAAGADVVVRIIEGAGGLEACSFVRNPAHSAHAPAYFAALDSQIARNREKDAINRATLERFAPVWRRNIERNTAFVREFGARRNVRNVADYAGRFAGRPFLILAAGPTLSDFLPQLPRVGEGAVVVCVDTALRFCLGAGVEPDFVVLTDPQYAAFRHVAGLSVPDAVLVTEIAAYPSVLRLRCGGIALSASNCPLGRLGFGEEFAEEDRRRGVLSSGGSVATAAWDFSRVCGASEIFVAGLDLGFPGGQTHVRGATFEEEAHSRSTRLEPAETRISSALFGANVRAGEDYAGGRILTDDRMRMFAWWFEGKAAEFPSVATYSLSARSLRIPGFRTISPDDFLARIGAV